MKQKLFAIATLIILQASTLIPSIIAQPQTRPTVHTYRPGVCSTMRSKPTADSKPCAPSKTLLSKKKEKSMRAFKAPAQNHRSLPALLKRL